MRSPQKGRLPLGSLFFCLLLPWLGACAPRLVPPPSLPDAPALSGKVSLDGRGIAGAEVLLLDPFSFLPPVKPAVATTRSGEGGQFRLSAPPGTYLMIARRGDHFAFFGRNPIRLSGRIGGINLPLAAATPAQRSAVPTGGENVGGQVLHAGRPLPGARVFVYLDPAGGFRGPGYALSDPTGADGRFQLPLPPGSYFLVARHRPRGWRTGKLEPGDHFGVFSELPLHLGAGEQVELLVETIEVPSEEQMARYQGRYGELSGRVVDQNGNPLAGMRACLYGNSQMLDRPLAVSDPTGADGRFTLRTDHTGELFLGAREQLGGPPDLDERVGFYRGREGPRVEVAAEQHLQDLLIVVPLRR